MSKFKKSMIAIVPMVAIMIMAVSVAQAKNGVEDGGPSGRDKAKTSSSSKSSSSNAKHTGTDSARDIAERGGTAEVHNSGFDSARDQMERGAGATGVEAGDDNGGGQENEIRGEGAQEDNIRANEDNGARQGQSTDDINHDLAVADDLAKVDDNPGFFSRMGNTIVSFFKNIF